MYRLRNIVSHEYFGVDYKVIYQIATINLLQDKIEIEKIIAIEKANKDH